jgi:hypothetical protein
MGLTDKQQTALYFSRKRRRQAAGKIIAGSNLTVADNAANGTVVGSIRLAPGFGRVTFALTDAAGGAFALNGNQIVVANNGALVAPSLQITVQASDSFRNTFTRTLSIAVTEA